MNREYAQSIIQELLRWGVAEFYACAGARNFPLLEAVLNIQSNNTIVFNHFEERSAAFYAIGRIKALNKPIAVITTSGTAVGELLPATMEAYYSGLPLVLITADRPRVYRKTGAPQSAEQKNIFGMYVSKCFDLETEKDLTRFKIRHCPKNIPLHINVCFGMPLQSGIRNTIKILPLNSKIKPAARFSLEHKKKFSHFLKHAKNVLIIVSKIPPDNKNEIIRFLLKLNYPVYLESISNLRECQKLKNIRIQCADKIWENQKLSSYEIDSVIKIGGTPTHRLWRDLDETQTHIKVFSIHHLPFSGMPNAAHITTDFKIFFRQASRLTYPKNISSKKEFLMCDRLSWKHMIRGLQKDKFSEISFIRALSQKIQTNARVYLGNSMPIRNWDAFAVYTDKNFYMEASRGLNGIDGQISTFLGFSCEKTQNWGIFGDLTTLYDLAGFWMLRHRPKLNINIIVINNGGGKIFNRVLSTGKEMEFAQNSHRLEFENLAHLWGLKYKRILHIADIHSLTSGRNLIEILLA